jgi:glycosyltransferase involved in cell wall biosynthesis
MKKRVLILECGKGFGGALTSLSTFLDEVRVQTEFEFHLLTNYPQNLIHPGGSLKFTGILKRHKLYGPEAKIERLLSRFFPKISGHIAFCIDLVLTGLPYAMKVVWYIFRNHIDVVHLNNSILINEYGILAGFLSRRKCVVQVRAPEYPSRIAIFFSMMVHFFFPVSNFVKKSIIRLGIKENKTVVVPEGIDSETFRHMANKQLPGKLFCQNILPKVGIIGCLVPWKGHGVFLDSCKIVNDHITAEFFVAGDTPEKDETYKNSLINHAANLGISGSIHFLGHCPNVAPIINYCDIIVHASTSPEPFGRVVIEGMSLGKPVIASDAGGPAEVIENGVDGILVPPGDSKTMAEAIIKLINHPILMADMGKAAQIKVEKYYTAKYHASIILSAYRNLEKNSPV